MAQAETFPTFLSVDYDRTSGFRDFRADAAEAGNFVKRQFERDMADVQATVAKALTLPRGASDLFKFDTSAMRQSAVEAERQAQALRLVAKAAEEVARETDDNTAATRRNIQATQAAARQAEEEARALSAKAATYERLQDQINRTGAQIAGYTGMNRRLADSQRQVNQASIGAGQQLQDIAISLYSGQRAGVVFAQQLPQMAFALSALEGSTNKTLSRLGAFATFLSGPWGVAIGISAVAAGTLIAKLFEGEKAMEAMQVASDNTGAAQSALGQMFDLTTGKITNNTQALRDNIYMQQIAMQNKAIIARQAGEEALDASGAGVTTATGRAWARLQAIATRDPNVIRFAEDRIAAQEAGGRRFEGLGRGVAQGGISREDAGKILEAQRKQLGDTKYFALQDYLNRSAEEFSANKAARDMEAALGGKLSDSLRKPGKETKPKKTGGRDVLQEARAIEDAVNSSAAAVANLRGQFDDAPKDIDKAAKATLDLDKILKDIERRATDGKLTEAQKKIDAQTRKEIEDFGRLKSAYLKRPVEDRIRAGEQELELERLVLSGREDEAQILSFQHDVMRQMNVTTEEQLRKELEGREIGWDRYELLVKQREEMIAMQKAQERLDRAGLSITSQLREIDGLRTSIEMAIAAAPKNAMGAITGLWKDIRTQFGALSARQLTDQLFGSVFEDIEAELRKRTPEGKASTAFVESTGRATTAMDSLTRGFDDLTATVRRAANDNSQTATGSIYDVVDTADIVVSGSRSRSRSTYKTQPMPTGLPAAELYQLASTRSFERFLGEGSPIAKILGAGFRGLLEAGPIGGGIRGLSALVGNSSALGRTLESLSNAAPQIGMALQANKFIGSLLGNDEIKGGNSIGLISPFLTRIFGSAKRGSATITGSADDFAVAVRGNTSKYKQASSAAADSVIDSIASIAEQLGGTVDPSRGSVSIGIRKGRYRVDPTGAGRTKAKKGVLDFGDDAEAAARAAMIDLINDGVIQGLKAGTQRLIQAGKDLDVQLQKALDFESVFSRLKEIDDPVGAALDTLDKEFGRLKTIFGEAGASAAEYADLERLYGVERAKAIEEVSDRVAGSLKELYGELTIGNNGKSLRDRLSAAQAAYDPLKARVESGDRSAFDAFAKAAQDLLGVQREFSGSQSPYFSLLEEVTRLTKTAIDREANIVSIAEGRDSPFTSTGAANPTYAPVVSAIGETNQILVSGFRALLAAGGGNGISPGFQLNAFL